MRDNFILTDILDRYLSNYLDISTEHLLAVDQPAWHISCTPLSHTDRDTFQLKFSKIYQLIGILYNHCHFPEVRITENRKSFVFSLFMLRILRTYISMPHIGAEYSIQQWMNPSFCGTAWKLSYFLNFEMKFSLYIILVRCGNLPEFPSLMAF